LRICWGETTIEGKIRRVEDTKICLTLVAHHLIAPNFFSFAAGMILNVTNVFRKYGFFFLLGVLFSGSYLIATNHGNLKTFDSRLYQSVARNIREAGRINVSEKEPLAHLSPLYPLLLSLGLPRVDRYVFWLHLISAWVVIGVWIRMSEAFIEKATYRWWFGLTLTLSTPLMMISVFVWSEMVFLLLFSLYLLHLYGFSRNDRRSDFWLATLCGFLLLLQRNAGIFLFTGIGLGWLLNGFRFGKETRPTQWFVIHCLLVGSGFAVWNISRIVIGNRPDVIWNVLEWMSPATNLSLILYELSSTWVPRMLNPVLIYLISGTLLIFTGFIAFFDQRDHSFVRLLWITLISYLTTWLIMLPNADEVSRYLSVVLPVFYFLVFYALAKCSDQTPKYARWFLSVLALLSLAYQMLRVVYNALRWGGYDVLTQLIW